MHIGLLPSERWFSLCVTGENKVTRFDLIVAGKQVFIVAHFKPGAEALIAPLGGQKTSQHARAGEGVLQVQTIEPPHDHEIGVRHRPRQVVDAAAVMPRASAWNLIQCKKFHPNLCYRKPLKG